MASEGATWRSAPRRVPKFSTRKMFHVSDAHGKHSILPDFEKGETWDTVHDDLHAAGAFGQKGEHAHGES